MSSTRAHETHPGAAATTQAPRRGRTRALPYLVAADETSLSELEMLVATLPICATGRVFVEVAEAADEFALTVPPRMTVTFLPRASRSGSPGSGRGCGRGEALTRAVTAWADETMCDEMVGEGSIADEVDAALRTRVHVLAGYLATADIVDHLTGVLGTPRARIHTPERFGLQTAR